jgi:signal peptidase I
MAKTKQSERDFEVRSNAMAPSFKKGQNLKLDKYYYANNKPQRWDVIVFAIDNSDVESLPALVKAQNPDRQAKKRTVEIRPSFFFCKRIVALPSESIQFTDSSISVNGKELKLPKELVLASGKFSGRDKYAFGAGPYKVPNDMVFVISDNTVAGIDSRHYGPIHLACVHGRVSA